MYYQSYEEYMRDVLGYPRQNRVPTYGGYYGAGQRNVDMEMSEEEIERLYPEIYRMAYPMVCKACTQYRGEINDDLVSRLTDEVYSNLEIEQVGENENSNREVRNSQATRVNSSSRVEEVKKQSETRQRTTNNTLRDLIRILIIRELLRRRRRPERPPFPGRPPFNGNPRPPMPRDINTSSYDINSPGMQGYYENMY